VELARDADRMSALLTSLLKIGGVTALTIGVFFLLYRQLLSLLYRQLLSLRIYAKLGATQTLVVVVLVAILVWLTAMTALLKNDRGAFALVFGNENQVIQGAPIDASK
jgi:hypothetical protein